MADLLKDLNANQIVPMNISLDGSNVLQTGQHRRGVCHHDRRRGRARGLQSRLAAIRHA